jgi:hypothetical protein
VQLIHGDEVDVARAQMRQHRAQERWLDFEVPVGLEFRVATGAHVVQHENGAHAGKNRPQQAMRTGAVQRLQAGANDGGAELAHQGRLRGEFQFELSEGPLNKPLAGRQSEP